MQTQAGYITGITSLTLTGPERMCYFHWWIKNCPHLWMCLPIEPWESSLNFLRYPSNEMPAPGLGGLTTMPPWWNSPSPGSWGRSFTHWLKITECLLHVSQALFWANRNHFTAGKHRHQGTLCSYVPFSQRDTPHSTQSAQPHPSGKVTADIDKDFLLSFLSLWLEKFSK